MSLQPKHAHSAPHRVTSSAPAAQPTAGERFPSIDNEAWIAKRLGDITLYVGATNAVERRERIRDRIVKLGLAETAVGRRGGREEVWREFFERIFGVPFRAAP
jgi:hypothetical protein